MNVQFQDFFHNIIEDKDAEDNFTRDNKEIPSADISEEFHGPDLP